MGGYKTWIAAILSVGYGVGGLLLGLHDADTMMGFVVAGLGMVGLGHKVDRLKKT